MHQCFACSKKILVEVVALCWQAYNVELRRCFVSLSESPKPHVESSMQQLTLEALRLVGCRLLMNPQLHQAFMTGQYPAVDTGQIKVGQVVQQQLDQTFYTNLLVSQCGCSLGNCATKLLIHPLSTHQVLAASHDASHDGGTYAVGHGDSRASVDK